MTNTATVILDGRKYAVIPFDEYKRLAAQPPIDERGLPPFPRKLSNGNYPAIAMARVTIARSIIIDRRSAGLSQAELARRAGIRGETLNRIEKARVTADVATVEKIDKAIRKAVADRKTSI